jgi:L-alanine-DL-glutamate epimerase-like enolase superfamily enzyme
MVDRRMFLVGMAGAGASAFMSALARAAGTGPGEESLFQLHEVSKTPLAIASVELLRTRVGSFVRSTTADGASGLAFASERIDYLHPILTRLVAPYFVGKDARDLESLIDGVYIHNSNYKLAGLAFWCCVAWVEYSLLDLLGRVANRPVGGLLGGVIRRDVPVYLSSLRRDNTPEQEVDWLGRRLEQTGARAVKIKIGGRMSRNADAAPGRTEQLIALARKRFGEQVALMADANGSYDSAKGIEVGRKLQDLSFAFYEEPCPFEELEETKRVADALEMTVAGGEQDASLPRFRWMAAQRVVDLLQPDVTYNGGLIRTIRVARVAAAAGLQITPHSPAAGPSAVPMLQFASRTPNLGQFQEYRGEVVPPVDWCTPAFEIQSGTVKVPTGPGLGIEIDPAVLRSAPRP